MVAGDVTIEQAGTLTTITASDGSILEAERLNVLADETLEFVQPHDLARVLARVMGVDPTTIDGNLLANGVVYIVNPSGVFFGGQAVVDVGRLVAGAGEISDADFRAGIDRFTGLEGRVENAGTIHAGAVSLVGRSVANHGRIVAPDGMIAMVAGEEVFLGSLDGASKFVKGDAIAGLLITILNLVMGLIIGVVMHDMEVGRAFETYAILTVGDGLVSQIPAVIISIATAAASTSVHSQPTASAAP